MTTQEIRDKKQQFIDIYQNNESLKNIGVLGVGITKRDGNFLVYVMLKSKCLIDIINPYLPSGFPIYYEIVGSIHPLDLDI